MYRIYKMAGLLCMGLLGCASVYAQDVKHTISGYIQDAESSEKLIGATVFLPNVGEGTVSNTYGFYSITLPQDTVYLAISYVGYTTQYYKMFLDRDVELNFDLAILQELSEVVITDKKYDRLEERTQMSVVEIPVQQINKIPALLGERDVLKALQLMPGVKQGVEGSSGIYVRGGSPDQNLMLLDGTPVYNASHLFGFFSVFNSDAINKVELTKGGFPARYGGRLSSVLDISMKEGNMKELEGTASIGLVASRLTLEGPIVKDKASFIVSGRRTYIDLLMRPFFIAAQANQDEKVVPGYYFYDFNAKVNYKVSEKDRLYLSGYFGQDKLSSKIAYESCYSGDCYKSKLDSGIDWGNTTAALRWNHQWSNKLFSNLTTHYSNYKFDLGLTYEEEYDQGGVKVTEKQGAAYLSGIEDVTLKWDFDYVPTPNHFVRFGTSATHHTFKPGATQYQLIAGSNPIDTIIGTQNTPAGEMTLYAEDDFKLGKKLKANIGVHTSAFIVDEKTYLSAQPRVSLSYLLPGDIALKGSFATMTQYIHLLTNEGLGLPTDLWVPTTNRVIPENSWQAAIGLGRTFLDQLDISLEAYYKRMDNVISYKEGASFLGFESDWQNKVEQGEGEAYGTELLVQKKEGKLTGWVGYTLSWANRTFPNINNGNKYPFKYDRRHDLSVVGIYALSSRINLSGSWVFSSGNAITLPLFTSSESPDPKPFEYYYNSIEHTGGKNQFRMPPTHRLDVNIDFIKQKKRFLRTWSIGAYNAYNNKNPFFIDNFTECEDGSCQNVLKKVSLFPVIPYFAWTAKF
jgi:hypothetical protein